MRMTGFGQLDLWRLAGQHRNKDGYAAAAALIARVGNLYERAATPGEFAGYLDEVKAAHRQKRNFMAALAAHGL